MRKRGWDLPGWSMTKRKANAPVDCNITTEEANLEPKLVTTSVGMKEVAITDRPIGNESYEGVAANQKPTQVADVAEVEKPNLTPVQESAPSYGPTTTADVAKGRVFDPNQFWGMLELIGYEVW